MQICCNPSVSFADSIPTPFVPSGHFPLIGGIGPWKGSLCPPTTAVAEMVEVWYYDTITGEKETHYAADIRI